MIVIFGSEGQVGKELDFSQLGLGEVVKFDIAINSKMDYTDYNAVLEFLKKYTPDCVINFGGFGSPIKCKDNNFDGFFNTHVISTFNICKAIQELNKKILYIHISSLSVYGIELGHISRRPEYGEVYIKEIEYLNSCWYMSSKIMSEQIAKQFAVTFPTLILRLASFKADYRGGMSTPDKIIDTISQNLKIKGLKIIDVE